MPRQSADPGDGHDGIWNIIVEIAPNRERREILDWYHLMENLHKVGGSLKRLEQQCRHKFFNARAIQFMPLSANAQRPGNFPSPSA